MALTVKEIVKQNNEKRKLLTPENESYYENLLVFIRTNAFRKERDTEEVLLEMLDHFLEAQNEGKSAEDVFGKTPKELGQEIIDSLPKESIKETMEFSLEMMLTIFGWFLVVWGIMPLIQQKEKTIHLGSLIVSAMLLIGIFILLIYLVFSIIRKNAFNDKKKKMTWIFSALIWSVLAGGFLLTVLVDPFGPQVSVSYYTGFGLGCFFLLATYILKKSREAK